MTVTVNGPGGVTINFADGTDHDTINSVMTQYTHPDANVRAAAQEAFQNQNSGAKNKPPFDPSQPFEAVKPPFDPSQPNEAVKNFTITSPEGKRYSVQGPAGSTPEQAYQVLQKYISGGAAANPDKYQQAAKADVDAADKAGLAETGFTRRLAHGATLGADNTLLAAAETPLEMIKRGTFNPVEGYNYAKAREDEELNRSRQNTGTLGTAAELLGGAVTGGNVAGGVGALARDVPGIANVGGRVGNLVATPSRALSFGSTLAPDAGLLARSAASAADAAGLGGVSGFNEGNGLTERLTNAATGAGAGALFGGALPVVGAIAKGVTAPIFANVKARINPEGYANSQIARGVAESGQTPAQLGQAVADGNAAGQPFTLADAMGNPGQRMLSTVTRAPGEGRTAAVDFLNNRQAGQADRVGDILDTGLGAGGTARQTADQLTQTARNESAPFYQKALDKKPVWSDRMQQFFDDPATTGGLKEGVAVQRLEALAEGKKFDPNDYAITHFDENGDPVLGAVPNMRTINLIKKGWDNQLEQYRDGTTGKLMLDEKGRALDNVRRSFLKEVDSLNPDYATARALYAGPAQVRDAVTAGTQAAMRGRAADNIARFRAMTDPSKQGYRTGYADTRVGAIERAPQGTNVVRPLASQKAQQELGELSLHQGPVQPGQAAPMQQGLNREQTMFETRNQALGGSKTADNLNDDAALGVNPHLVGQIVTGNWHGAIGTALRAGHNALTGNTPEVRAAVGRMLLDQGVTPARLQDAVGRTVARIQFVQKLARGLGRSASGSLASAHMGQSSN
jgi:hypothetical protein